MSDDDAPDPGTPGRYEVPHAGPAPASVRPGFTAPRVELGRVPELGPDFGAAIHAARVLFRLARLPRCDPEYRAIRPMLAAARSRLRLILERDDEHAAAAVLLAEVRYYLGEAPR